MQDFDWVGVRASCHAAIVFETLKSQVEGDVKKRNEFIKEERNAFSLVTHDTKFSVQLPTNPLKGNVTFSLLGERIVVHRKNNVLYEATLTLNDEGECCLNIGGQLKDFWQARKMALEDLLFN